MKGIPSPNPVSSKNGSPQPPLLKNRRRPPSRQPEGLQFPPWKKHCYPAHPVNNQSPRDRKSCFSGGRVQCSVTNRPRYPCHGNPSIELLSVRSVPRNSKVTGPRFHIRSGEYFYFFHNSTFSSHPLHGF